MQKETVYTVLILAGIYIVSLVISAFDPVINTATGEPVGVFLSAAICTGLIVYIVGLGLLAMACITPSLRDDHI